jgi:hypothetical protein
MSDELFIGKSEVKVCGKTEKTILSINKTPLLGVKKTAKLLGMTSKELLELVNSDQPSPSLFKYSLEGREIVLFHVHSLARFITHYSYG